MKSPITLPDMGMMKSSVASLLICMKGKDTVEGRRGDGRGNIC